MIERCSKSVAELIQQFALLERGLANVGSQGSQRREIYTRAGRSVRELTDYFNQLAQTAPQTSTFVQNRHETEILPENLEQLPLPSRQISLQYHDEAGTGHFSKEEKKVIRVRIAGEKVAYVAKPLLRQNSVDQTTRNEEAILRELTTHQNPYICNIMQVHKEKGRLFAILENGGLNLKILMEQKAGNFSPEMINKIMHDLLHALEFLGGLKIIHSDIKMDNLLWRDGRLKICDFGLASKQGEAAPKKVPARYMPPEVFQFQLFTPAVDIWSAGCTLFELTMSQSDRLFPDLEKVKRIDEEYIKQHIRRGAKCVASFLGDQAKDLFLKMMVLNHEYRIKAHDALRHPFITSATKYVHDLPIASSHSVLHNRDFDDDRSVYQNVPPDDGDIVLKNTSSQTDEDYLVPIQSRRPQSDEDYLVPIQSRRPLSAGDDLELPTPAQHPSPKDDSTPKEHTLAFENPLYFELNV